VAFAEVICPKLNNTSVGGSLSDSATKAVDAAAAQNSVKAGTAAVVVNWLDDDNAQAVV